MSSFDTEERFDRIVSIEMFEHMRKYERLLARAASWLKTKGTLFQALPPLTNQIILEFRGAEWFFARL